MTTPESNTTLSKVASNVSNNPTGPANSDNSNSNSSNNNDNNDNNDNNKHIQSMKTTQFWINQPSVLLDRDDIADLWPMPLMSVEQKLNAITRLVF